MVPDCEQPKLLNFFSTEIHRGLSMINPEERKFNQLGADGPEPGKEAQNDHSMNDQGSDSDEEGEGY